MVKSIVFGAKYTTIKDMTITAAIRIKTPTPRHKVNTYFQPDMMLEEEKSGERERIITLIHNCVSIPATELHLVITRDGQKYVNRI